MNYKFKDVSTLLHQTINLSVCLLYECVYLIKNNFLIKIKYDLRFCENLSLMIFHKLHFHTSELCNLLLTNKFLSPKYPHCANWGCLTQTGMGGYGKTSSHHSFNSFFFTWITIRDRKKGKEKMCNIKKTIAQTVMDKTFSCVLPLRFGKWQPQSHRGDILRGEVCSWARSYAVLSYINITR